jgi:hypothetical protein
VSFQDLLERVSKVLEAAQVPYMLTGSYASSVHGTPRATQDLDIVISPTRSQLANLVQLLPDTEYYVSDDAAMDAFARRSQFNVIDFSTGWKVDFIIIKDRDFSRTEFERRRLLQLENLPVFVASPEDVLVAKLEWAKLGSSGRQIEDAAGIVRVQGEHLDVAYVEHWVTVLALQREWSDAKTRADG